MDKDQEKPIDTVSIVLLILISLVSDISDLVTDLIAAVPVLGQIIYLANSFLISPITWAIIQIWFIMKVGLSGRKGLITGVANLFGGLGNIANLPGSETIMTTIAIVVANHGGEIAKVATLGKAMTGVAAGAAAKRNQRSLPRERAVATAGAPAIAPQAVMTSTAETPPVMISDEFAPQTQIERGAAISEEEFGVKKEPLEQLKEVMERIPEPEKEKGENI